MSNLASVSTWLENLKQGDDSAAIEIWNRYVSELVNLARRKLKDLPRREADEEDLVIMAFNAFFEGVKRDRFYSLHSRQDLWQVLIMITERKAIDQIRRLNAQIRGSGNVRGESVFEAVDFSHRQAGGLSNFADAKPTSEFAARFSEEVEACLKKLNDPVLERLVLLKLEGRNNREIADQMGRSLSTIERKLQRIERIWQADDDER